jgi:hypothetical protein
MKLDRVVLIAALALLAAGWTGGWFHHKGCNAPEIVRDTTTVRITVPDTAGRAKVYAQGYAEGKASVPRTRIVATAANGSQTMEYLYDDEAVARGANLQARIDSMIAADSRTRDLVANSVIEDSTYIADLFYHYRERSFEGTDIRMKVPRITETIHDYTPTFWQRFGYGPVAGLGASCVPVDGRLSMRPGGFIGVGFFFDLSK